MTYQTNSSEIEQTLVQRERWPGRYGPKYTSLVYPGQRVSPDQPVLRLEYAQSVEHKDTSAPLTETISAGLAGSVVSITARGGVVIEGRAILVQGRVGFGTQVAGILTLWPPIGSKQTNLSLTTGAILVVAGPINFAFLQQAIASGASGVIASSISMHDLEGFLRTDVIQLFDLNEIEMAQMHLPPITLFLTEGLGTFDMPQRLLNLFSRHQGAFALLSGITSTRRTIFPELLIS